MVVTYRDDARFVLPDEIRVIANDSLVEVYALDYDSSSRLTEVSRVQNGEVMEFCGYEYSNGGVTRKRWSGTVNEGIHGNNQNITADYQFTHSAGTDITALQRELHSNLNPFTSIVRLDAITFVYENSNTPFKDTMQYKYSGEWVILEENDFLKYSFREQPGEMDFYEEGTDTLDVLLSNYRQEGWPLELKLLLNQLIDEGAEDNILLFEVAMYFDKYIEARMNHLPVMIGEYELRFEVDTFGRLKHLWLANDIQLSLIYAE